MRSGCVFAALLLCSCSFAQSLTREVKGVVRDQYGHPLRGAVVQIENTVTLEIRSFVTEASGDFHFAGVLTNADYELRPKYRTQWGETRRLSKFDTHNPAVVDLTLKLEGARNEAPR